MDDKIIKVKLDTDIELHPLVAICDYGKEYALPEKLVENFKKAEKKYFKLMDEILKYIK